MKWLIRKRLLRWVFPDLPWERDDLEFLTVIVPVNKAILNGGADDADVVHHLAHQAYITAAATARDRLAA